MSHAQERSPAVRRSRSRAAEQVQSIVSAAQRLIVEKGDAFTTQELIKEAGVAFKTFYRYFASKDELLLAVISDEMETATAQWAAAAADLDDPLSRLQFYIGHVVGELGDDPRRDALARFVITTRGRLHRLFPEELARADEPFVDLLHREIQSAAAAGQLTTGAARTDAWFIAELIRSVYCYWAFVPGDHDDAPDRLWQFCLRALGGLSE